MYSKYSDDELIEAYSSMLDYSGKIENDLMSEIESRGGMERFQKIISDKKANHKESTRIIKEVIELSKQGFDLEKIKQTISSELWSKQHLYDFIDLKYLEHKLYINDISVDNNLVFKSILGFVVSTITGSVVWCFSILYLKFVLYPFLVAVYFISYFIIRGLTGKSHNNAVVFLAALAATIGSFVIGFILLKDISYS